MPVKLTFDRLVCWCARKGLDHQVDAGNLQIVVPFDLAGRPAPLHIVLHAERPLVTLAMIVPISVPAARRAAVVDALNIVNVNTFVGAWLLTGDGRIFTRATVPSIGLDDDALSLVATALIRTAETFAEQLVDVVHGLEPLQAMAIDAGFIE
jgi:hypothetical protein